MCGRYASTKTPSQLAAAFDVDQVRSMVEEKPLEPDYNVAPSNRVYAVLERAPRDEPDQVQRRLTAVRWGLVPSWAKDTAIGNRMINARLETAASKPSFRRAWSSRRCILPADGYYEWYQPVGDEADQPELTDESEKKDTARKATKPRKIPFFIRPRDGGLLAMAGLYEIWRDESKPEDDPDAWLWTTTVLTTDAADEVGRIHERMPLVVPPELVDAWLDPRTKPPTSWSEPGGALQAATPSGSLEAFVVSTLVNNVRNNGPELLEPVG